MHAQPITQPLIVLGFGGICNSENIWTKKILWPVCNRFWLLYRNTSTPLLILDKWGLLGTGRHAIPVWFLSHPNHLAFRILRANACTKSQCSADAQSYCFLIQFSRPWNSSNNGTYIPQFSARRYKHHWIHNRSSQWNHIIKSLSMREGAYENEMIRCLHLLWAHQHLVEIFFQICCKVSLRLESTIWGRMISPLAISSWNCH